MIASTVWNQLVTTLQAPSLRYIKYVYEGLRIDVGPETLPCIQLEPIDNSIVKDLNQTQDKIFSVDIYAFSSADYSRFNKTIVGDDTYKGIVDIENDISAVLNSSYSLGDTVIDVQQGVTQFDLLNFEKYPVRGLKIPIKIKYRQVNNA